MPTQMPTELSAASTNTYLCGGQAALRLVRRKAEDRVGQRQAAVHLSLCRTSGQHSNTTAVLEHSAGGNARGTARTSPAAPGPSPQANKRWRTCRRLNGVEGDKEVGSIRWQRLQAVGPVGDAHRGTAAAQQEGGSMAA